MDRCKRPVAGSAPLSATLDAPAQEVEPLVNVADSRLLFREAQAYRSEDAADLVAERFNVVAGSGNQDDEVIRIANEPHYRATGATVLGARP
jgi:hypothetical protein